MNKTNALIQVLIPTVLLMLLAVSYYFVEKKTGDRFTGTDGKKMLRMQEEAFKRIECRQLVFIRSSDKTNFEQLRKQLKDECE